MKALLISLIAGVLVYGVLSCAQAPGRQSSAATMTLDESQNGKNVTVSVGQTVTVALRAQFGTGFSWSLDPADARAFEQVGNKDGESHTATKPGEAETQVFRLRVRAAGTFPLKFDYRQPWKPVAAPAKTFLVTIVAK